MKKGQAAVGQIFIYIMVLIVGSAILLIGYNAIKDFRDRADEVVYVTFENEIRNDFKTISYGSSKLKKYDIPSGVDEVCFAEKIAVYGDAYPDHPLIASLLKAEVEENLFLYPGKENPPFFLGKQVDIPDESIANTLRFKCFDVISGSIEVRITGQGNTVRVE